MNDKPARSRQEEELVPDYPPECDACGGDRLPLKTFERQNYGVGPASQADQDLCEICANSYSVSRWRAGLDPLTTLERDVLAGNHILLAEIRKMAERPQ